MKAGTERLSTASVRALTALHVTRGAGYRVPLTIVNSLSRIVEYGVEALLVKAGHSAADFTTTALACLGLAREGKARPEWLDTLLAISDRFPENSVDAGLAYCVEAMAYLDAQIARDLYHAHQPADPRLLDPRASKAWLEAALAIETPLSRNSQEIAGGMAQSLDNPQQGSVRLFWLRQHGQDDIALPVTVRRRVYDASGQEVVPPAALRGDETYVVTLELTGVARHLAVYDFLPAGLRVIPDSLESTTPEADSASTLTVNSKEMRKENLLVFASLAGSGTLRYRVLVDAAGAYRRPGMEAQTASREAANDL